MNNIKRRDAAIAFVLQALAHTAGTLLVLAIVHWLAPGLAAMLAALGL